MAENTPQFNFESQPSNTQPQFSAEDIRSRLNAINNYINTNQPEILSGLNQAQADQAEYVSKIKSYMPVGTSPIEKIQNQISGNVMTGPNPGLKQVQIPTVEYVDALMNKSKIDIATKSDPYFFARPTSFNASKYGLNYDRYYSHPKFKDLGFSIYRDNEALYNAKSTWLDDFRRMWSKWVGLAWQGGSSLFKNWGQFGAFGEAEDAAEMEHDLSVAMSSKGGAGAWTTNFLANSAYTVGIIGEIATEEFALWGATALTGGAASPLATVRTGQNLSRLGKSIKIMAETLSKADKAKSFWTAARGAGASAAKIILPGETLGISKQALDANSAFNRLSGLAKASKTFGAFYRDMREINAVTAESRLEGGFVQNKVANDALAEFIKKNNRMPNVDEAKQISDRSFAAGKATMLLNVPAIYLSNKLVLGTALKGFSPIRRLMNKEALSSNIFKTVSNYGWKAAGKKPMEVVQKGLISSAKRTFSKDYLKAIPSRLKGTFSAKGARVALGGGIRYFSANLAEGLQESYQEAMQAGMSDYYLNEYFADLNKDPFLAAKNSMAASIMKGIGEQFTMQGLDVFAQGFLMGGAIGGVQNIAMPGLQRSSMKIEDLLKGTNKYEEYLKSEKERLQKYADAVNSYTENPSLYAHWLDENVAIQRDLAERYETAEKTGDRKEAEDAKDDSLFNHVHTLLQNGKLDGFIEHLEGLKELSDEELAEAFGKHDTKTEQNKKSPRERLDIAIKKAKDIQERFELATEKFKNPYNPDYFDKVRDKEAYEAEMMGYTSFEIAKKAIIFNEYTFDRTINRLASLVNNAATNGPLGNVAASDFSVLYSNDNEYYRYINTLKLEIEALSLGTAQEKRQAKKKQTQLDNLSTLISIIDEYSETLYNIEKAKFGTIIDENDNTIEVQEIKKFREKLREQAIQKAKNAKIINEDKVDPVTGQLSADFEGTALAENYSELGIEDDVILNEIYKEELYEAYAKYAKNIAGLNNVFPIPSGIENSFADLVDYLKLDIEAKRMSDLIDLMADPMAIFNMSVRVKNAMEKISKRKKELHFEALADYKENIQDVNDLLEKLFGIGVYFDPDAIKAFRKTGTLPDVFLNAADGSVIDKTNPKYQEIINIITEEEILRGKTFSNKPVVLPTPQAPSAPTTPVASTQEPPSDNELEETAETTDTTLDVTTPFAQLPIDIQNKLREAHANAMLSGATSDIQEWMLESPEAAAIVTGVPLKEKTKEEKNQKASPGQLITAENPKSLSGPTPDLQPIYDALEKEGWKLNEDQTKYISADGKEAFRVSDLKEGKVEFTEAMKAAARRGNILDIILREFATPVERKKLIEALGMPVDVNSIDPKFDNLSIKDMIVNYHVLGDPVPTSKDRLKTYLKILLIKNGLGEKHGYTVDEGFISDMADVLYDLAIRYKNYTWHTSLPTMVGELVGKNYGGTIDLLIEKDGKYYIIDLKTSVKSRRTKEELYDKNDQIQQNAYAELFEQLTGKSISGIYILNLLTKTSSDNKTLQAVQLDFHKNEKGQNTILNALPRVPVAELKGYKPETPKEGDDIASFFGNIGNQGLAVMEADMLKTSKHTISGISKATPEQRKKIDSDIEELKKKYPEKNITSKVENDNLIVESGVTAPASNIEAEKQKITPSEFKEVVRLAKFFLENPSEPGVIGDARSRYPELFKAVTDIERRRQEKLDALPEVDEAYLEGFEGLDIKTKEDKIKFFQDSIENKKQRIQEWEDQLERDKDTITGFARAVISNKIANAENEIRENEKIISLLNFDSRVSEINKKYDDELAALTGTAPITPTSNKKAEKPVINIYWGSPESSTNTRVLSNLAPRKFTYQGREYGSVEHAYQTLKSGSFDQVTYDKYVKAGGYGTKIRGKAIQKGFDNLQLMRDLVVESFKQNPEQAKLLLNYSDFTHTTNEVIDKAFLEGIRLAQKNAELAALGQPSAPVSEELTLPIQNGTITIAAPYTGTYAEYWDFKVENGKLVSGTHRTYFEGEYRDRKTSDPITNLEEVYREKSAVERYKITSEETTPKVDWNAVIDRATSAQEVDKIMDQIYAANASTPELIDKALVKKQSFKPAKIKVPSRFAGKIIWAQPGTINPELFTKYDVINSDDVVEEIAQRRGIVASEGETIHETIQNQSKTVRDDIQTQVINELERLKNEGKTIISSNWYVKTNGSRIIDIISSPAAKEALFMKGTSSSEESIAAFEEYINKNEKRKTDYEMTQKASWSSQIESLDQLTEKNTNATVEQLFERDQIKSTPLRSITNAGTFEYLYDSLAAYIYSPEIRSNFKVTNGDGSERILSFDEVIGLAQKRAESFKGKLNREEYENLLDEMNNLINKEINKSQLVVSEEDKTSAQDAITKTISATGDISSIANDLVNAADKSTQKDVDNEFFNNIGC